MKRAELERISVRVALAVGFLGTLGLWLYTNDALTRRIATAQQDAALVMGFDESHAGILASPKVVSEVQRVFTAAVGAPYLMWLIVRTRSRSGGAA